MINAEKLSKLYEDGHLALDALDLGVGRGEIYALLGANGAGKTTAMNLFLGLIRPTAGRAFLAGVNIEEDPLEAKRHAAFLDESVKLYGSLTAIQNVRFFVNLGGGKPIELAQIESCLARAGLQRSAWTKHCSGFSKGMRQKVGLAIVMAKDTETIFLDEPTSGLDPKAMSELLDSLREIRSEGKAILMNTHDIFRARQVADRLGILKQGKLVQEIEGSALRNADVEALYMEYGA